MAGPTTNVGTPVVNGSCVAHGRRGGASAGPTEAVGRVDNDDNIVVGAVAVCSVVDQTTRQPSSTNPTREPIPARNRTEVSQATQPPRRRQKTKTTTKCCGCARNSTCQSKGERGRIGCSCLLEGRKCTDCACFRQCKNKRILLPPAASDRRDASTLRSFFQPLAASANPTGDHSPPPPSQGNQAPATAPGTTAGAAPSATTAPAAAPTAANIGKDDANGVAPAAKPAAAMTLVAGTGKGTPPRSTPTSGQCG